MRRVPADQVKDYIMGYTITNDISDRQGRGEDVWSSATNDPLLRKGKDSSKPIGPFIVPAEFVDPLNLPLKMTVGGVLVQDATHEAGVAQRVRVRRVPLEPDHGAGGHGDRDGHAARLARRPRALHGGRRHPDLLVRRAGHADQSRQERGNTAGSRTPGHHPALKKVGRGGITTAALDECDSNQ